MSRRNEIPEIGGRSQRSEKRFGRRRDRIVVIGTDGKTIPPDTRRSRRRAQEKLLQKKAQQPGEQRQRRPNEQS